ncbi:PKD domain-containing protein [Hwanghaeella grinnelliae]|uniref:PKD domain-containing protein n=1 Tax=Hwanghaeella grinnelliae TaxID=2500179 RepID=A0A3S2VMM9_9PROT|nr:LamG-like jellyroll fold domain-containing protein [Hwanghaeella grinnelliae]RVU34102.1 PKD domain-containing protein [Hwanghaeella grinnelliae]
MTNEVFSANSEIDLLKESWDIFQSDSQSDSLINNSLQFSTEGLANLSGLATSSVSIVEEGPVTIVVSTSDELDAAVKQLAKTGGEIVLNPGEYGHLSVRYTNPESPIEFRSADPENPAQIGSLGVKDSSSLVFDGLDLGRALGPNEPTYIRLINVTGAKDVTFINNDIHGSVDGDSSNDGYGLSVTSSEGIVVANNEFHDLARGALFGLSSDLTIQDNFIHDIRTDGLDFAGVHDVLIEGNYLTKFSPTGGDHADFIQFWTTGAGNSSDVTIRNNALIEGNDSVVQGIFIENDIEGNTFSNFNIEGNIYYGSSSHGIVIDDMQGGSIINNTVLATPTSNNEPTIRLAGSTNNVVVTNNVATNIGGDSKASVFENNVIAEYDNPSSPTHIENLFVNPTAGDDASVADLVPRQDGLLTEMGVGALVDSVVDVAILTEQRHGTSESLIVDFSAADYADDLGGNVTYRWTLSDGTVLNGEDVQHEFKTGGSHHVVLSVLNAEGEVLRTTDKTIELVNPILVSLDFEGDVEDANNKDSNNHWIGAETYADGSSGQGAVFDEDTPSKIVIPDSPSLRGMSELTVQFDMMMGDHDYSESGSTQRVVWSHLNYGVEIVNPHTVKFYLWLEDGGLQKMTVNTSSMQDGEFHQLTMTYSDEVGSLVGYIDGEELGRLDGLSGNVADNPRGVVLGSGPHRDAFDGALDNVLISQSFTQPGEETDSSAPSFQEKFDGQDSGSLLIEDKTDVATFTDAGLHGTVQDDDQISVFLDLKSSGDLSGSQRVLWNHMEYGISIEYGALVFTMFDEGEGMHRAFVRGLDLDDGDWHQVGFTFNEETDEFTGYFDGEAVTEMDGLDLELDGKSFWGVTVGGTPWGRTFEGEVDNLYAYANVIDPAITAEESNSDFGSFATDELFA